MDIVLKNSPLDGSLCLSSYNAGAHRWLLHYVEQCDSDAAVLRLVDHAKAIGYKVSDERTL